MARARPGGLPLPARLTRPALALAAVTLALFGVSRTTGSGWLVVVVTGLLSVLGLAAVLPAFGLARVTVAVDAPRDATVGRPTELTVELGGGSAPVSLRPRGWDAPWTGAFGPCRGALEATPTRRGVYDELVLDVRGAAPLGLVWWRRRVTVALTRPLSVGPRPAGDEVVPPE
ncbi:MAG TPA: hypothetical protein VFO65_00805, partial [Acidimicrobiales bacterium]|nr:hypothetical protein [Acidimicrobiales bacterium]